MASLSVYGRTAGAVHSLGYHMVWCPKYRKPLLTGPIAERLSELLHSIAAEKGWTIEALEVMPDHVQVFVRTPPSVAPAEIARRFKGGTSRIMRDEFPILRRRLPTLWSKAYFIASVGRVSEATIRRYIEEQSTRPIVGVP